MPRKRNVVSKLVVDYGDPDSIGQAITVVKTLADGVAKSDAALGKLADHMEALFGRPMLAELRQYPPRRLGMRIRWTSERQRRYVMALLREQAIARGTPDDIAYRRTGELADGWVVEFNPSRKGLRVRVYNIAENERGQRYQPFVTGGIGLGGSRQSMKRYDRPMQRFHKDRGWKPAAPIIQKYIARIQEYAVDEFEGELERIEQEALKRVK